MVPRNISLTLNFYENSLPAAAAAPSPPSGVMTQTCKRTTLDDIRFSAATNGEYSVSGILLYLRVPVYLGIPGRSSETPVGGVHQITSTPPLFLRPHRRLQQFNSTSKSMISAVQLIFLVQ